MLKNETRKSQFVKLKFIQVHPKMWHKIKCDSKKSLIKWLYISILLTKKKKTRKKLKVKMIPL